MQEGTFIRACEFRGRSKIGIYIEQAGVVQNGQQEFLTLRPSRDRDGEYAFKNFGVYEAEFPPFSIGRGEAQTLMDDLYRLGIRPTDAQPTGETFKAMNAHLNDMRAIVAEKLKMQLP